jgi:hypothetical protein
MLPSVIISMHLGPMAPVALRRQLVETKSTILSFCSLVYRASETMRRRIRKK